MTVSGPDALRSIEEALRDIRREEDETVRRLARAVELAAKLRVQESAEIRQLSAMRLDAGARAELSAALTAPESGVTAMLAEHDATLAAMEAELAAIDDRLTAISVERLALREQAAAREIELGALAAEARPRLGADPGFAEKLAEARRLAAIAELALLKTAAAEADCDAKGRPFRDDPLFMHLWSRGYGTASYKATGLARWLDGKVAALIGYARAREIFATSNDIPLQLRQYAEHQQELARAAAAELAALESVAVDSVGGGPAREAIEVLRQQADVLEVETLSLEDRRDETIKAQREVAQGRSPAFVAAQDTLAAALEGPAVRALLAAARAAPKGQDVALRQQLDDLKQRRLDAADEALEQRGQLRALALRRRDLEDIQYEIKASGFDAATSDLTDDSLVGDQLTELLRGMLTAGAYWDRWRAAQKSTSGPVPPSPAGALSRPRIATTGARLTSAA